MTISLIQTVTVASGQTAFSISFNSIPQDGTDLLILASARVNTGGTENADSVFFRVNSNSSTTYRTRFLEGTGSSVFSGNVTSSVPPTNGRIPSAMNGSASTPNTFSNFKMTIPNYFTNGSKTLSVDSSISQSSSSAAIQICALNCDLTTPVTSLTFRARAEDDFFYGFVAGSSFSLYKITKGSIPGIVVS